MSDDKENIFSQIPTGVLENTNEMLSFINDDLSDDNGRLTKNQLQSLRDDIKNSLQSICSEFMDDLINTFNLKEIEVTNINDKIYKEINDWGLVITNKLSTRYQNAHERITFKTVVGYVFEEIDKTEIKEIANNSVAVLNTKLDLTDKTLYIEKFENILQKKLNDWENKLKSMSIPCENKEDENTINNVLDQIHNPKFVEDTIKRANDLLDNQGKKAMLNYVKELAETIVKLK